MKIVKIFTLQNPKSVNLKYPRRKNQEIKLLLYFSILRNL